MSSEFNWFSRRQDKIVIRDNREVTHYTAFAFAKSQRKLRRQFDRVLISILPATEHITTGHGYRTKRQPFSIIEERHFFALSMEKHFCRVFYIYFFGIFIAFLAFLIEIKI